MKPLGATMNATTTSKLNFYYIVYNIVDINNRVLFKAKYIDNFKVFIM